MVPALTFPSELQDWMSWHRSWSSAGGRIYRESKLLMIEADFSEAAKPQKHRDVLQISPNC